MKKRYGFVSNSSSSSFVVVTREDLTIDTIIDGLRVKQGDPLYFVAKEIAELAVSGTKYANVREFFKRECGYDTIEEAVKDDKQLMEFVKNLETMNLLDSKFATFYVSNEDYDSPASGLLYGTKFEVKTDGMMLVNIYD